MPDLVRSAAAILLLVLAGVLAAGAYASARPVTAHDRALLARPATAEEKIAEEVAERLTRPPGRRRALRVDRHRGPARAGRDADARRSRVRLLPHAAGGVHVSHVVPRVAGAVGPAHVRGGRLRVHRGDHVGSSDRGSRVVPPARLQERGAGRLLRHAVDLVRRHAARGSGRRKRRHSRRSSRPASTRCGASRRRRTGRRSARTVGSTTCARRRTPGRARRQGRYLVPAREDYDFAPSRTMARRTP